MLTSTQSPGVTPEVNVRITLARKLARYPPWLQNPGQMAPKSKTEVSMASRKGIYVLQIFMKKQKTDLLTAENRDNSKPQRERGIKYC